MNDPLQQIVPALQVNYRFRELKVMRRQPMTISTERGRKKIRIWDDEPLLKRHISWRRQLSGGRFFVDRMYATQSGRLFVPVGRFFLTCHDAPRVPASLSGNEAIWADVCAALITGIRDAADDPQRSVLEQADRTFSEADRAGLLSGEEGVLARKSYPTVRKRAELADRLRSAYRKSGRRVILPEDVSLRKSKALLGTVFIELGQSRPVPGCRAFARFFLEWMKEGGTDSIGRLFSHLKKMNVPDRETSDLIRAEWYEPDEWFRFLENLAHLPNETSERKAVESFETARDRKNRLIRLFDTFFRPSGTITESG
ncbi:hypothetical protein EWH99_01280 [Sporolactobacillus sp. THM7-7]|nr:hypothetical protein EWH99_01280 [Sporolactobacillus sp. THM7-7]